MNLHENRCRQCKKLFCCVNCRLAHENKKHSKRELKCSLCCSKKLQITGKESEEFICHLVFNHLPLLCRLCGKSFSSDQDLVILQKCGWWKTENSQRLLQVLGKSFPPTTPLEIKTFLNSYSNKESVTNIRHSSDFVTFNSPPVLTRNTSTPVHIGLNGPKSNLEFKSSNAWSFLLKTPRRISPSLDDKESWPNSDSEIKRWNSDTQFYSGLYSQSRSSLQGSSLAQKSTNSSTNTTDYYSCDQLEADCNRRSILGTRVEDLSELEGRNKKEIKESTKRVRFSDHFEQLSEMAENDKFFEARENVSITSYSHKDSAKKPDELENLTEGISNVSANQENQLNVERENRVCAKENTNEVCLEENKVPLREDRFCLQKNQVCVEESSIPSEEDKENSLPSSQQGSMNPGSSGENPSMVEQSGSSRVVMMLLVENTSRFSRSELRPLIDSGLKKLEQTAASMDSVYFSTSGRSSPVKRNGSGNTESQTRRRSVTSVNSYLSVTSTECFSAQSESSECHSNKSLSSESVESSKSDGIFSVVARVVKSALRKLPGARLLQEETSESTIQHSRSPSVSTSELPTLSFDSTSSFYSTLKNPPSKRPRDPTSPPAITGSNLEDEEKSPVAKRPRGWCKIRAREPIARMKKVQVTSPKGVSSEIQRFQLGSLSVGRDNIILPLPSRAHQSTQTEQNSTRIN